MKTAFYKRLIGIVLVMLFSTLSIMGCAAANVSDVPIAMSAVPRNLAPDVLPQALAELSAGNTGFAFDLYRTVCNQEGNLFYSPYSISVALAMTQAGARNKTEKQIENVLHFTLPQEQLHPAFNALDLQLIGNENFKLKVANSIWGQQDYTFRAEYLDLIAKNYGAGLRLLDFKQADKREQARLAINRWVEDQTEGKIKELTEKDILTEKTRLVLANAVYFKADWKIPFPSQVTQNRPFTLLDGTQVQVPTMSLREELGYHKGTDYQAVGLDYKGGRVQMVILLPSRDQFSAFEKSLTGERITTILKSLKPSDVKLYLPKFSYAAKLSLGKTLPAMGMLDAFTPFVADFSGMDRTRDLYISQVEHKAFIAVDEKGTEAAAATGMYVEIVSMPTTVEINRPFIFLIRDTKTNTILFIGRVLDPTFK